MKTTIDIPEPLYKQAKIRAVETGQTLKSLVLISLSHELSGTLCNSETGKSFLDRRKVLPAYENALKSGSPSGGLDSTMVISEDRASREDALL